MAVIKKMSEEDMIEKLIKGNTYYLVFSENVYSDLDVEKICFDSIKEDCILSKTNLEKVHAVLTFEELKSFSDLEIYFKSDAKDIILDLAKSRLNLLEEDFIKFCNVYNSSIISHAEHLSEGVVFKINLDNKYYLIIKSENQKVKSFEVFNSDIHNDLINPVTSYLFEI